MVLNKYIDRKKDQLGYTNSEELCNIYTTKHLDRQGVNTISTVQYLDIPVLLDANKAEFVIQEAWMSI